jgi:hypothetical protein
MPAGAVYVLMTKNNVRPSLALAFSIALCFVLAYGFWRALVRRPTKQPAKQVIKGTGTLILQMGRVTRHEVVAGNMHYVMIIGQSVAHREPETFTTSELEPSSVSKKHFLILGQHAVT